MQSVIIFENVVKKYQLGISRTSIPTLISDKIKNILGFSSSWSSANKELLALRDISFHLGRGESLGLIGPNGAGKTTILKLLANITKPTSGRVETKGKLSALIELGAGFHPDLTGRENIYLNGTILGLRRSEIDRRFEEIVDFAELSHFIDTPVKHYSSGMFVRLGFAVASCIEPDILLVDEVLAVGDAAFRQKCMKRIQSLIDQGTSILFVSHNLYMVQAICQKSLYLKKGMVQRFGDTKDVIEAYENDLHVERASKFDFTDVQKHDQDSDIEITKIEILSLTGEKQNYYFSDQCVKIQVYYVAYRDFPKINMSVFVIRSDGLTCFMLRTKLHNFNLDVKRGVGTVAVNLEPLQLITGMYFIEAWFLDEADSMSITPRGGRSDWFAVKGYTRSYEDSSGVYQPIAKWEHIPSISVDGENCVKLGS